MTTIRYYLIAPVLAALLSAAALAQQPAPNSSNTMSPATMQKMMQDMMPMPSDTPATTAFKQADMRMMLAMDVPFTRDSDLDFVQGMIPHHQGAIDMARIVQRYGKDAQTKKWAAEIISSQEREISEMQEWLKKNHN